MLRFTEFIKNNKYYETSILDESLENNNKLNPIKENNYLLKKYMENYKIKLLSSYWTEINLIGYKIELLEKQKVEYLKEKSKIIYIGNKISKFIYVDNKLSVFVKLS